MDLNQYTDTMKFLKNKLHHSYDYIVSEFVYNQLRGESNGDTSGVLGIEQ